MSRNLFVDALPANFSLSTPDRADNHTRNNLIDSLFAAIGQVRSLPASQEMLRIMKDPFFEQVSAGALLRNPDMYRVSYALPASERKPKVPTLLNYFVSPDGVVIEQPEGMFPVPQFEEWLHFGNHLIQALKNTREAGDHVPTLSIQNTDQGLSHVTVNLATPRPGKRALHSSITGTFAVNS